MVIHLFMIDKNNNVSVLQINLIFFKVDVFHVTTHSIGILEQISVFHVQIISNIINKQDVVYVHKVNHI